MILGYYIIFCGVLGIFKGFYRVLGLPNIVGGLGIINVYSYPVGLSNLYTTENFSNPQASTNEWSYDTRVIMNVADAQSIYKKGIYQGEPNWYETPQSRFLDVRTRSISVSRYLKAF